MKKKFIILIVSLLFFASLGVYAQESLDTLDVKMWRLETEINFSTNKFFNNAYNLYKSDKYLEALKLYNIYISYKDPKAMPFYERSLIKYALGDYNGALSDYQESLKLGLKTIDLSKFKEKPVDIENLINSTSSNRKCDNDIDNFYFMFGNYRNMFMNNQKNHNNSGLYLLRNGYYEDAIKHLQIAIKENPNKYAPHYNLALSLYLNKQYDKALDVISNYIEQVYKYNQDEEGIYYIKNLQIKCLLMINNKENALKIENKYNDFFTIAYFELLNKNYTKAKKILRSRSSLDNYDTSYYATVYHGEIHNNLAYIEYLNKEFDKAYVDINKAKKVALKYNDVDLYMNIVKLENFIINELTKEQKEILYTKINKIPIIENSQHKAINF